MFYLQHFCGWILFFKSTWTTPAIYTKDYTFVHRLYSTNTHFLYSLWIYTTNNPSFWVKLWILHFLFVIRYSSFKLYARSTHESKLKIWFLSAECEKLNNFVHVKKWWGAFNMGLAIILNYYKILTINEK